MKFKQFNFKPVRKYRDSIIEDYLDDAKEFYDYHTGNVNGSDIFDTTTTGVSYYNSLIPGNKDNDYYRQEKNISAKIIYMTPTEYFNECSKLFGTSPESLMRQRRHDEDTLKHLEAVIIDYGRKFPMPMINWAHDGQEGLHRAMVAGDLFGWDEIQIPVLIIDWDNKSLHFKKEQDRKRREKQNKLDKAIDDALDYEYGSYDEIYDQLDWSLSKQFEEDQVKYTHNENGNNITISLDDVSSTFPKSEIQLRSGNNDTSNEDSISDEMIKNMSPDEFNDYMKTTFGI